MLYNTLTPSPFLKNNKKMINPNLESLEEQAEREWQEKKEELESHAKQVLKKIKVGENMIWEALKEWDEYLSEESIDSLFMDKEILQQLEDVLEKIKTDIEDQEL